MEPDREEDVKPPHKVLFYFPASIMFCIIFTVGFLLMFGEYNERFKDGYSPPADSIRLGVVSIVSIFLITKFLIMFIINKRKFKQSTTGTALLCSLIDVSIIVAFGIVLSLPLTLLSLMALIEE